MCFHRLPPTFPLFRNRLSQSPLSEKLVHSDRHVWIPLEVPLNKGGDQLVAAVVANAEEVAPIAYAPSRLPPQIRYQGQCDAIHGRVGCTGGRCQPACGAATDVNRPGFSRGELP